PLPLSVCFPYTTLFRSSGCLSCCWVGFPPAPRFQLLNPTNLTAPTTLNHFLPHLSRKSFIVKQKLEVGPSLSAPLRESTRLCGLDRKSTRLNSSHRTIS